MGTVDLHLHSSVSDGRFSPAEVVRKAAGAGLTLISITDHDNVDGIASALEAAVEFPGLTVIPGVEISTDAADTGDEVHMLGYFIDYTYPELLTTLAAMRDSRKKRAERMVAKLATLGMPVEWRRVQEIAGPGTIGRPHIAQALLEKGYIATFREAFEKYIADGGPAYIEREKIDPAWTAALIRKAGGLPVMAHPLSGKQVRLVSGEKISIRPGAVSIRQPEATIAHLKKCGLAGIEAYYGGYKPDDVRRLACLADKYGLIATAGSDYHGLDETSETRMGGIDMPPAAAAKLRDLAESRLGLKASHRS